MASPVRSDMQPSLSSGHAPVTRAQAKKLAAAVAQKEEPTGLLAVSYPWTKVFRPNAPREEHMRQMASVIKQVTQHAADSAIPPMTTNSGPHRLVLHSLSRASTATIISRSLAIFSWSSMALTKVLDWRNPQAESESKLRFAAKVIATEVALAAFPVAAAIESVVYSVLALGARALGKIDSYDHNVKLLKSSSFTIVWATADLLFYNIFRRNVPTQEWGAWTQLAAVIKK